MKESRNVAEVIGKILEVIPREESKLRNRLLLLKSDAWFQPPESTLYWEKLRDTLVERFPNGPNVDWAHRVSAIIRKTPE